MGLKVGGKCDKHKNKSGKHGHKDADKLPKDDMPHPMEPRPEEPRPDMPGARRSLSGHHDKHDKQKHGDGHHDKHDKKAHQKHWGKGNADMTFDDAEGTASISTVHSSIQVQCDVEFCLSVSIPVCAQNNVTLCHLAETI